MKKKLLAILFLLVLVLPCFAVGTLNVYAQESHTVTFMVDGEVYATDTVADGDTIKTIPSTPIKNGSVFEYWELNGEKFSFVNAIESDVVLNAKWDEKAVYYKVQFMVDGVVVNTQEVEKGQPAVEPKNPQLPDGKSFVRWDNDFSSITQNTTINAVLEDKSYTVRIYSFSGDLYDMIRVPHGETITTLPQATAVPAVPHYVFTGYDYKGGAITEDTDIKMVYTPEEYTVTFEVEGQIAPQTQQVKYRGTVKFPAIPIQDNYVFAGWYESGSNQAYDFNSEVDRDLHLVARFIPIEKPKYEVNFFTYDGVQYGGTQMIEEGQSAIQPGNPTRYGYTFLGWTESLDEITGNLNIYPIYQINEYTVKFIVDGDVFDTQMVKFGDSAKEPDQKVPEKQGYDFVGWSTSLKNITSNVEITAVYRVKTFAVMFYDEYNKKIGATQYVQYGKSAVAPKLGDKAGYVFNGWSDGNTTALDNYKVITEDVTFIAEYTVLTYKVTFYEGYQVKHEQTVKYGEFAPMYTYTNGDKIFVGWFANNLYDNAFDFTTPITKDTELYAYWQDKPTVYHTVSFCVDGNIYFGYMV
ncbi:MAG: InlB B-repeat-containing protein, partial [Clostridia bacterium]|nr:InlB B-repeat-containing protein [Clostridia bacterium]